MIKYIMYIPAAAVLMSLSAAFSSVYYRRKYNKEPQVPDFGNKKEEYDVSLADTYISSREKNTHMNKTVKNPGLIDNGNINWNIFEDLLVMYPDVPMEDILSPYEVNIIFRKENSSEYYRCLASAVKRRRIASMMKGERANA